jgi:TRAP-type C4-dicarboxylate transport system substrate-binding protein
VYSRADLSRIAALVVAPFLAAAATGAVAREFRAADTRNEDYPTVQALRYMGRPVAECTGGRHRIRVFHSRQSAVRSGRFMREKWKDLEQQSRRQAEAAGVATVTDFDRKPFEAAMAAIYQRAERDPAAAQLIERIRKVE